MEQTLASYIGKVLLKISTDAHEFICNICSRLVETQDLKYSKWFYGYHDIWIFEWCICFINLQMISDSLRSM